MTCPDSKRSSRRHARGLLGAATLLLVLAAAIATAGTSSLTRAQDPEDPPARPASFTVTVEPGLLNVNLDWSDVDGASEYWLRWRSVDKGERLSTGLRLPLSETTLAMPDYGTWVVRVQACNDAGCSKPHSQRFTVEAPTVPGAPANLAIITTPGDLDLSASWDALDGATSYKLSWRQVGSGFEADNTATVTAPSAGFSVDGIGQWLVRLVGCNIAGCGDPARQTVMVEPQPNRAPQVDTEAAEYASFVGSGNAPRGVLVTKPFDGIFADPDGDELTYSVDVDGALQLIDLLRIHESHRRVFFRADADADWKAIAPPLADPLVVTATLTATDPSGLSASLSGDFIVAWESWPEVVSANATRETVALTFDLPLEDAPRPEQFAAHVINEDGDATTIAVGAASIDGNVLTLLLEHPLTTNQTVTVSYTADRPDALALQRAGGGRAAPGFTGQPVDTSQLDLLGPLQRFAVSAEPGQNVLLATWNPLDGATSYRLRWRLAGEEFEPDNALSVSATTQFITVSERGRWEVWAQACDDAGCGPETGRSAEVTAAANLRLELDDDADGQPRARRVTASWDPVDEAESYTLRWERLGSSPPQAAQSPQGSQAQAGPSASARQLPDEQPATNRRSVPAGQTNAEIDLPDGGAFRFTLDAQNGDGKLLARANNMINQAPGQTDTTQPRIVSGKMDGDRVTLYYSEPLDANYVGGAWHPYIQIDCCSSTGGIIAAPMKVNGNTVTIDFGGPMRAVEGLRASIVYWVRPGQTSLRDPAGNLVYTPNIELGGSRTSRDVSLHNITGRPKVRPVPVGGWDGRSGVAISPNAGDDRYYLPGEQITVELRFTEEVDVTGTPRLQIDLDPDDGGERWADYTGGAGTQTLKFAYTVVDGDDASQGVAVLADTLELNGGAIIAALARGTEPARLGHDGLGHDPRHRVVSPSSADPILSAANVNGTTLTLTFSEPLSPVSLPNSAFKVSKTDQDGLETQVGLSGSPVISGDTVTLTLASAVLDTDTGVKLSYTPAEDTDADASYARLIDLGGAEVADFYDTWVDNDLDVTAPRLLRGEIEDLPGNNIVELTLYFSEALDEHSWGPGDTYRMHLQAMPGRGGWSYFIPQSKLIEVSVTDSTVVVKYSTFSAQRPIRNQYVLMDFFTDRKSAANRLRDVSGNPVHTPRHYSGSRWRENIWLSNLTQ